MANDNTNSQNNTTNNQTNIKHKKTLGEHISNSLLFITIAGLLFILYFWIGLIFHFINKEEYKTLIFFLILSGIVIIIFGYWFKWSIYFRSIASPYTIEHLQILREKWRLKEKIILSDKIYLCVLDGYSVKICNIVGIILISIGFIVKLIIK